MKVPVTFDKLLRRTILVAGNAGNTLLAPALNVAVSATVVRITSLELWGAFVQVLILVQLGAHIAGWGNKDYLLRAFSRNPATIGTTWRSCLITRLPLAGILAIACLTLLPKGMGFLAAIWMLTLVIAQSHDALVTYYRRFNLAFGIEAASVLGIVGSVVWRGALLDSSTLLGLFALANLGKTVVLVLAFRQVTTGGTSRDFHFDTGYFRLALPFFLVGISGLLQSRADLYLVSAILPHHEVGRYQTLTNLLLYVQAVTSLILGPFLKGIYRLPVGWIAHQSGRLFSLGLALIVPAMAVVALAMWGLYGITLTPELLLLGGLLALPAFGYSSLVYALFSIERQLLVAGVTALGLLVNIGVGLLLIPRSGITGALAASALAQWVIFAAYQVCKRRFMLESTQPAEVQAI